MDDNENLVSFSEQGVKVTPMPQYQCNKKVWALQIKAIELIPATSAPEGSDPVRLVPAAIITPMEDGYGPFEVTSEYVAKHLYKLLPDRVCGGYYVRYEDGYESFSPQSAFENGYVRI